MHDGQQCDDLPRCFLLSGYRRRGIWAQDAHGIGVVGVRSYVGTFGLSRGDDVPYGGKAGAGKREGPGGVCMPAHCGCPVCLRNMCVWGAGNGSKDVSYGEIFVF